MKKIINAIIKVYQKTLSPDTGIISYFFPYKTCRFIPTCSQYTKISVNKYGVLKGIYLSIKRILKCGPWHKGGVDYP